MTKVVNVKVQYIRPKYNNLKEWCDDTNNVYIGRKCIVFINSERYPKKDSIWANPFKITTTCTREDVILTYKNYIVEKLDNNIISYDELIYLKNKSIGCWCKNPEYNDKHPINMCHGDILMDLIENYKPICK